MRMHLAFALAGSAFAADPVMRRTAVTNMIEAGIPGDEVMEIVGHRTNAMLRRYMITSEKTAIRDGIPNKPN